jgi:hypothetical protein
MRIVGLTLLLWTLTSPFAMAQTGLQRFEEEIRPYLPLQTLTYSDAQAIGSSGFALRDVRIVVPATTATRDKEISVNIDKLVVEALDFDRLKAETHYVKLPRFGTLRVEGVSLDERLSGFLQTYGIPKGPIGFGVDYRLSPGSEQLTVSRLELTLPGRAYVALSFTADGISEMTNLLQYAKDVGRIRQASLLLLDHGLVAKILPAVASTHGLAPKTIVAIAKAFLITAAAGDPDTTDVSRLLAFLSDWKQPKGPLTLSISPQEPMKLGDFAKALEPGALSKVLGLVTNYPKQADSTGDQAYMP